MQRPVAQSAISPSPHLLATAIARVVPVPILGLAVTKKVYKSFFENKGDYFRGLILSPLEASF
jgi:hypothetical protein